MAFDSSADLLFRIGADPSDAQNNIARFRTLLSKDLAGMQADFAAWATKVFGSFATVGAGMASVGAIIAAGAVAAGAALISAGEKAAKYAMEIEHGSRLTGLSAEQMSRVRYEAQISGLAYEGLVKGLAKFEVATVHAAGGNTGLLDTFHRLGISDKEVQEGQKNLLPLLYKVADAFHNTADGALKAAAARDLFALRGVNTELLIFLSRGSEWMKAMGDEAERLGFVFTEKDVKAAYSFTQQMRLLHSELEGIALSVGKSVVPALMHFAVALQTIFTMWREPPKTDWKDMVANLLGPFSPLAKTELAFDRFGDEYVKQYKILIDRMKAAMAQGPGPGIKPAAPDAKDLDNWMGMSALLEQIKGKIAGTEGETAKAVQEMRQLQFELTKTTAEYEKLLKKGELTGESAKREAGKVLAVVGAMSELGKALVDKIAEAQAEATAGLRQKLLAELEQTLEVQETAKNAEVDADIARFEREKRYTGENVELLAQIRIAGIEKIRKANTEATGQAMADLQRRIDGERRQTAEGEQRKLDDEMDQLRDQLARTFPLNATTAAMIERVWLVKSQKIFDTQKAAFDSEMAALKGHLQQIQSAWQTAEQRIAAQYEADVAKYSAAEEKKALIGKTSPKERAEIEARYAAIRGALLVKEGQDLQALRNSQGWQGVFGAPFGQMIKGNEALLKEWAASTNQSVMLVRVTMEGLKETAQESFKSFSQGMGQSIANAFVYQKSIGEAMRAAAAATAESIAAQAFMMAIYALGWGFWDLAIGNYTGAANAFKAAGIFALEGAAAAAIGRGIAPAQAGAGTATSAAGGGTAAGAAAGAPAASNAQGGPHVTVNVWGHVYGVSGVQELAAVLNDAVLNKDVVLTATNTKSGVQVTR
jgi:hypothetical protein